MSTDPNALPDAAALDRIYNHPTSGQAQPAPAPKSAADRIYNHPTSTSEAEKPLVKTAPLKPAKVNALVTKAQPATEKSRTVDKPVEGTSEPESDDDQEDDEAAGDDVLEGLDIDESFEATGDLRDIAAEYGLDKESVGKLAEVELKHRTEYWDRQTDAWFAEIKKEPDCDVMCRHANSVVKKYGGPGLAKSLGPYASHAGLVRMLGRIGRELENRKND